MPSYPNLLTVLSEIKPEEQSIIKVLVTDSQVIGCFNLYVVKYYKEHDSPTTIKEVLVGNLKLLTFPTTHKCVP